MRKVVKNKVLLTAASIIKACETVCVWGLGKSNGSVKNRNAPSEDCTFFGGAFARGALFHKIGDFFSTLRIVVMLRSCGPDIFERK